MSKADIGGALARASMAKLRQLLGSAADPRIEYALAMPSSKLAVGDAEAIPYEQLSPLLRATRKAEAPRMLLHTHPIGDAPGFSKSDISQLEHAFVGGKELPTWLGVGQLSEGDPYSAMRITSGYGREDGGALGWLDSAAFTRSKQQKDMGKFYDAIQRADEARYGNADPQQIFSIINGIRYRDLMQKRLPKSGAAFSYDLGETVEPIMQRVERWAKDNKFGRGGAV